MKGAKKMESLTKHMFSFYIRDLHRQGILQDWQQIPTHNASPSPSPIQIQINSDTRKRFEKVVKCKRGDMISLFDEKLCIKNATYMSCHAISEYHHHQQQNPTIGGHVSPSVLNQNINNWNNKCDHILRLETVSNGIKTSIEKNEPLKPLINLFMGLLKSKEQMEDILYTSTVLGVHNIHIIKTDKSEVKTSVQKLLTSSSRRQELDLAKSDSIQRWKRISIAAAEQSKQFYLPQMHPNVMDWNDFIELFCNHRNLESKEICIWFDANAKMSIQDFIISRGMGSHLEDQTMIDKINVFIGPEADLTRKEMSDLEQKTHFSRVKLTPTILQSKLAVAIGIGTLRSCLLHDTIQQNQNEKV